jgi:WD40 repeat protein
MAGGRSQKPLRQLNRIISPQLVRGLATALVLVGLAAAGAEALARTDRYGDPLPEGALARLGTVRLRHGAPGASFVFAAGGKVLVSAGWDDSIRIWDTATGKELPRLRGHQGIVHGVALSPDGKVLASAGADQTVRLWEAATGKPLHRLPAPRDAVGPIAFSPDGRTLALVGQRIYLWQAASGKELHRLGEPRKEIPHLAVFSPDGKTLYAAGGEMSGVIRVWDVATGRQRRRFPDRPAVAHPEVYSLAVSPDGKVLAAGVGGGTLLLWDAATGKLLHRIQKHHNCIDSLSFSPDGRTLASASDDHTIRLWQVATGQELRRIEGHLGRVCSVAFAPDGKTLASGCCDSCAILLLDAATGKETCPLQGHHDMVLAAGFLPGGKTLVTASSGRTFRLWEAATGRDVRRFAKGPFTQLAFSPDHKVLAQERDPDSALIDVRETATGKLLREIRRGSHRLCPRAFSADGKRLLAEAEGNVVVVWDLATGKEFPRPSLPAKNLVHTALSPDGKTLACSFSFFERAGGLWDVDTGQFLCWFGKPNGLAVVGDPPAVRDPAAVQDPESHVTAFSADGRLLAWYSYPDPAIHVVETATGKERLRLRPPGRKLVLCLGFAPHGRLLASGGQDRAVHLWDIRTGREHGPLRGHLGTVACLAFAADGKALVSGSEDTTALVWDLTRVVRQGPARPRPLSSQELGRLWTDLAGDDAARAHRAMGTLEAAPAQAVPFLQKQLRPVRPADPRHLRDLIADLDSKQYPVRQRATRALAGFEELARPALRQALAAKPPLETRRRIERLLQRPRGLIQSAERLGPWRALEVLEQIGTPAARQVLEQMARGTPEARLTQEARESLRRLAQRSSKVAD